MTIIVNEGEGSKIYTEQNRGTISPCFENQYSRTGCQLVASLQGCMYVYLHQNSHTSGSILCRCSYSIYPNYQGVNPQHVLLYYTATASNMYVSTYYIHGLSTWNSTHYCNSDISNLKYKLLLT